MDVANAAAIAAAVARTGGRTDLDGVERQTLLVVELVVSLMSLASRVPPDEARDLIDQFVAMAVRTLAAPPPA